MGFDSVPHLPTASAITDQSELGWDFTLCRSFDSVSFRPTEYVIRDQSELSSMGFDSVIARQS